MTSSLPVLRVPEAPPRGLWERLREDPLRAPELIALAAADRFGSSAAEWGAEHGGGPGRAGSDLAQGTVKWHVRLARLEGAATGVGGVVTLLPDLFGLAWIQARMVFHVAAAYGHDPTDPLRPAELLVLMGIYDDVATARSALDGAGEHLATAYAKQRLQRDEALAVRLAKMVGKRAGRRFGGRLLPVIGVAFNASANAHDTQGLADRTTAFYRR